MNKFFTLDLLLKENNGYITTSEALDADVSKTYFGEYVRERELVRVAHGLYMSQDAWDDDLYVIQVRFPCAVFSHETALYLLNLAEREPIRYAATLKAGTNTTRLAKLGVKTYKIKASLLEEGICETDTRAGHKVRTYNAERTICDLVRSRSNIETQDYLTAIKEYVRRKDKNIPQLMRYANLFSVEKIIRQYLEVLL
ncbi:MAG: type IV toxin-antitoxin system AbiEi family antitoxin domain-containing protein [Oscillospiraceae bacterium]|nr:type IV toxin-antitoxin system AbiEi family antitoxin domain-containing protein [Oscillospiraceae bacterium]